MTLDNKLGLTEALELSKMEETISKTRAKELFEKQLLDDKAAGTYATLAVIHGFLSGRYSWLLIEETYDFAGQIRTVNLAKGNVRFAPVICIQQLPWKILTGCLSRPLSRLSKSTLS